MKSSCHTKSGVLQNRGIYFRKKLKLFHNDIPNFQNFSKIQNFFLLRFFRKFSLGVLEILKNLRVVWCLRMHCVCVPKIFKISALSTAVWTFFWALTWFVVMTTINNSAIPHKNCKKYFFLGVAISLDLLEVKSALMMTCFQWFLMSL